jgi:hypothetical protein
MRTESRKHNRLRAPKRPPSARIALLPLLALVMTMGAGMASAATVPAGLVQGAFVTQVTPKALATFGTDTHTNPTLFSDYLSATNGWPGMDGSGGSLSVLSKNWGHTGYAVQLDVPIIPTLRSKPVGSLQSGADLTSYAADYAPNFKILATNLVAGGLANAYLRLGPEFDNKRYAWKAWDESDPTPANDANYELWFKEYFVNIVTTMRAVTGANFTFVWNPEGAAFASGQAPAAQADPTWNVQATYPGSADVNVIGLDLYDQAPWATLNNELTDAHAFASQAGRPIAFSEWGVVKTAPGAQGDDPAYVNNMASWMANPANDVVWEGYFNASVLGQNDMITDKSAFPKSLAAFITDFG